jgi:hypothetical protein
LVETGNGRTVPTRIVRVEEVKALRTSSGNTRFVLRADDGSEYTTFKEAIARQAVAAEGRQARIEYHEQLRNGFTNIYLDEVESLEEETPAAHDSDEVAWRTAVEAAPWLLGEPTADGRDTDEAFETLQQFKDRVAEDLREDD